VLIIETEINRFSVFPQDIRSSRGDKLVVDAKKPENPTVSNDYQEEDDDEN
jgi:hypothetical protein